MRGRVGRERAGPHRFGGGGGGGGGGGAATYPRSTHIFLQCVCETVKTRPQMYQFNICNFFLNLKVLLKVYFSILFLILLYYQF